VSKSGVFSGIGKGDRGERKGFAELKGCNSTLGSGPGFFGRARAGSLGHGKR
jgi:hypothetical protein